MKYKYLGKIPAIILIGEDLGRVAPGEEVVLEAAPSTFFVPSTKPKPRPKEVKAKKQQDLTDATTTKPSRLGK